MRLAGHNTAGWHSVPVRKLLVLLTVIWIGVTLTAAWIAVDEKIPYDLAVLDRTGGRDRVGEDWLFGWGTGLAAPMAVVAAMAVLGAMSALTGPAGRFGAFCVALLGGASLAYTLANRPATERLQAFSNDTTQGGLLVGTLAVAALLVLIGFLTWLTAPRERWT